MNSQKTSVYIELPFFLTFKFYFILEYSWFTMYVTLVSSVQQHDLVIHTHIFILFQILFPIKVITEYSNCCPRKCFSECLSGSSCKYCHKPYLGWDFWNSHSHINNSRGSQGCTPQTLWPWHFLFLHNTWLWVVIPEGLWLC